MNLKNEDKIVGLLVGIIFGFLFGVAFGNMVGFSCGQIAVLKGKQSYKAVTNTVQNVTYERIK